jgi:hypothetical protein
VKNERTQELRNDETLNARVGITINKHAGISFFIFIVSVGRQKNCFERIGDFCFNFGGEENLLL